MHVGELPMVVGHRKKLIDIALLTRQTKGHHSRTLAASFLLPGFLDDLGGVPFHLGAPFPVCKVGIMIIARNAGNQTHFIKCSDLLRNLLVPLPSMTVIYDSPDLCN